MSVIGGLPKVYISISMYKLTMITGADNDDVAGIIRLGNTNTGSSHHYHYTRRNAGLQREECRHW